MSEIVSFFKWAYIFSLGLFVFIEIHAEVKCPLGECVPISRCQMVRDMINNGPEPIRTNILQLLWQTRCNVTNGEVCVCCKPGEVIPEKPLPRNIPGTKIKQSSVKTLPEIESGMIILNSTVCGKNIGNLISYGENAKLSEFPWMALLVYNEEIIKCGGSLITDRFVLTAAHCITYNLVRVRLGEHDININPDCIGRGKGRKCAPLFQEIDVDESIRHVEYNTQKLTHDIALVRLKEKAVFRENVQPICLPIFDESTSLFFQEAIIAGWGIFETGAYASVLQSATISMTNSSLCSDRYKIVNITENQICMHTNMTYSCKGDSGGPLFHLSTNSRDRKYVQYGIISFGSNVCGSSDPDVLTKVVRYLPWIAGNLHS